MLSTLIEELQGMKAQLGQFVTDFAAKQELAGWRANISQGPCRLCGHASTHRMQDDDFKFNDDESQPPQ